MGVLFDLDGTLVDTAPDLVAVLNELLAERARAPMPYAVARNEVSNGALGLLRLAFGPSLDAADLEALRLRFLELYLEKVCINSKLFINLDELFDKVSDVSWGIVTNKPHAFTGPLLERLGIAEQWRSVVSGDRLPQRKPHPAPLLLAAQEIGVMPQRCVYVGDAPRDIEAGRAAGMATLAASFGYIRPGESPYAWGADAVVRHPSEMAAALLAIRSRQAR